MALKISTVMLGVEDVVMKAAATAKWGGYFGYFSDPDGYLWKVATEG